jgi:hypothetical protein
MDCIWIAVKAHFSSTLSRKLKVAGDYCESSDVPALASKCTPRQMQHESLFIQDGCAGVGRYPFCGLRIDNDIR